MTGRIAARRFVVCLAALTMVLVLGGVAAAQTGAGSRQAPGVPVSVVKLVLLFALFVLLAVFGNWLAADAEGFESRRQMWYGLFAGGAALALLVALAIPIFAIGIILAAMVAAAPVVAYVPWRNKQVPFQAKVFTSDHIRGTITRLLRREKVGEIAAERAVHIGGASHLTENSKLLYVDSSDMPIRLTPETEQELATFSRGEAILVDALACQAGQVYLVPHGPEVLLRQRIVGHVRDGGKLEKSLGEGVIAFLKRLARLDVNEHRKPQTGRFVVLLGEQTTNVIIQTAGSVKGEHLVAKLHGRQLLNMHLSESGMQSTQVERFRDALGASGGGLVLMSAPKHNGRTVSMYAALRELDLFARNVVAVEQDISIEVPDVQQVQVNKVSGQTLAAAVQDVLRGDPDVVMVETIADADTAKMMLTGAAVGKIMIGGLVANDASEAIETFIKLAGDRQNVATTLLAATGQRLMRTLCTACREAYRPNPEFLRKANLQAAQVNVLHREPKTRPVNKKGEPVVCPMCHNEGYVGRTALYEVVVLDDRARQELVAGRSVGEIRTMLRKQGQEFLQEEGLHKVVDGVTSVSELLRVLKSAS